MRKLLLMAIGVVLCFSGCYKEALPPDPSEILVHTRWGIEYHFSAGHPIGPGETCEVADEVVFNADSTGFYYFSKDCKPGDPDTLYFRWRLSYDKKVMHYSYINGQAKASAVVGISDYLHEGLDLKGGKYGERYLDGIFKKIGEK